MNDSLLTYRFPTNPRRRSRSISWSYLEAKLSSASLSPHSRTVITRPPKLQISAFPSSGQSGLEFETETAKVQDQKLNSIPDSKFKFAQVDIPTLGFSDSLTPRHTFVPFRQLKTVSEGPVGEIATLETPNTLSGLGAALLTECEVCDQQA